MSGHRQTEPSRVLLDACTLVPIRLATTLLWLAEDGLFEPLWSEEILDEVERTLPKTGISVAKASRRVGAMRQAFGAVACVDDFDHLIPRMTCDRRDRHVLAAAVRGDAEMLATFNLRDFPEESTACHGVKAEHPDRFLAALLSQRPADVLDSLSRGTRTLRDPPRSVPQFLASLTSTVPLFANLAAEAASQSAASFSPVPAMTKVDAARAAEAFGEPGDLTNPAQVGLLWAQALVHDLGVARRLSATPRAWGDYQDVSQAMAELAFASRVIRAVDAPDDLAILKLLPDFPEPVQSFSNFPVPATFLTLVRLDDGTWRVLSLGASIPAAAEVFGSRAGRQGDA